MTTSLQQTTARAVSTAAPPFAVLIPGLRLVTLSNGPAWQRFAKSKIRNEQHDLVRKVLDAKSLRCPFVPPMVVTITRIAAGRMDSDNAVSAAKFVRDSIAKWIGIDDKHDDLVEYVVRQEKGPAKKYAVRIEIKPRGGA